MQSIDIKMKLLAGQEIIVGNIPVRPPTLKEISKVGYTEFQTNIKLLLLKVDDMIEMVDDFEMKATLKAHRHEYKSFDLLTLDPDMLELIVGSLKIIFNTEDVVVDDTDYINNKITIDGMYVIDRNNYDDIANIIDMQNNPDISSEDDEEDDYNPSNEIAKSIAEKLKKSKEIVKKSKAMESDSDGDNLTILDIISAVTAMSNSVNKLNVWDYTIYQLYEEFTRLNRIENYRLQIQASMWSSEIEIESWYGPL